MELGVLGAEAVRRHYTRVAPGKPGRWHEQLTRDRSGPFPINDAPGC